MEWFEGTISSAIQSAKLNKKVFIVVVHGGSEDKASQDLLALLDEPSVSLRLKSAVSIRLENGTESCKQFAQLYPVILVPSIYFIDSSTGVDIEITGGLVAREKLMASIEKAMGSSSFSQAAMNLDDVASPRGARVEQARQVIQQQEVASPSSSNTEQQQSSLSLEERVERAKRLLAEKQALKAKEEEEKLRNTELSRRDMGKLAQDMKRKQEDESILKAAAEKQKEREEKRLALQKVKEQIAQDRADRAAKFNSEKKEREEQLGQAQQKKLMEEAQKAEQMAAERGTIARVQFRLHDGSSHTTKFPADETLAELYRYVNQELKCPLDVSLSTTFPRQELDQKPRDTKLRDAGLVPSGTVLVLPKGVVSNNNEGIMAYVWLLLTPVTVLWNLIRSFIFPQTPTTDQQPTATAGRKRQAEQSKTDRPKTAYKRRAAPAAAAASYRQEGNITRFTNGDDDEDESNTYNGNSTQQM